MHALIYQSEKPPTIQEKVHEAQRLCGTWRERLQDDSEITKLLTEFKARCDNTRQVMDQLGVVAVCRDCEENQGGSCCGVGIENKYSDVLLLVNLLLGVPLPQSRRKKGGCYFLGDRGCTLRARDALCINYVCFRIEDALSRDELIRLQHVGGEEVDTLFILYEEVKKKIRHYGNGR